MTVLLILGILAAVVATGVFVIKGIVAFRRSALEKFGYKFFRLWHFLAIIGSVILILSGYWLRGSSYDAASRGNNGLVLMTLGAVLFGWLFAQNCLKTNLVYGVVGTGLEILLTPTVWNVGLFFIAALFLGGGQFLMAEPVRVVNQNQNPNYFN